MKRIFFVLMFALLAACSTIGTAPAASVDENLAYSLGAVTSVRLSTADALDTGAISTVAAKRVLDLSDQARALIDAARLAHGVGDDTTALVKLALVTQLLVQMQTYAAQKGGA